jgi:phosphoenolpyruvate carboxylase
MGDVIDLEKKRNRRDLGIRVDAAINILVDVLEKAAKEHLPDLPANELLAALVIPLVRGAITTEISRETLLEAVGAIYDDELKLRK